MSVHDHELIQKPLVDGDHYHYCTILIPFEGLDIPVNGCFLDCKFIPTIFHFIRLLDWIKG